MEVPVIENRPLGPIHSLVRDGNGNVYLSDEINHRVLCLTAAGELSWWKGGSSAGSVAFRYPRGLALGQVRIGERASAECLAVCDSWNNRVIFLNLDGEQVAEWRTAGERPLREVSDVRNIVHPDWAQGTPESCWLLLDRGNHRLCWIASDGEFLRQTGQTCVPYIEERCSYPGFEKVAEEFSLAEPKPFPPFDCLYYPTRLIGGPGPALAVFEPLRRSLKVIHRGFLFPLPHCRGRYDWLSFNDYGCLGWDTRERVLAFVDLKGRDLSRIVVDGMPICADLAKGEWWQQQGQILSKHAFVHPFPVDVQRTKEKEIGILHRLAEIEPAPTNPGETGAILNDYLLCLKNLLGVCE